MTMEGVIGKHAQAILDVLHYVYSPLLLFFFLAAFLTRSALAARVVEPTVSDETPQDYGPGGKPLPRKKAPPPDKALVASLDFSRPRKLLFDWLSLAVAATFLASAALVIIHALAARQEGWWCGKPTVIYIVGSFFVHCLVLISLIDSRPAPTSAHLATWSLAVVLELVLVSASTALYTHNHREPKVDTGNRSGRLRSGITDWEALEITVDWVRIVLLGLLVSFYLIFVVSRNRNIRAAREAARSGQVTPDDETTGLLSQHRAENGSAEPHADGYGSTYPVGGKHRHTEGAPPGWERPEKVPERNWFEYIRGYNVLFPYLWPSKDRRLQLVVLVCVLTVIGQRAVNLLVPIQSGRIVKALSDRQVGSPAPWGSIMFYIFLRFMSGNNGVLGAIRGVLWIPVSQYSYREITVAAFEHVHSLSLDFHLGKKTGEVISALGKGSSINTFLEQTTFQVLPMLVDLIVAFTYFLIEYDVYYGLVVAVITFWYVYLTVRMAQWRAEIRRQMVNADREESAVKNDSMISYETVKYFNAEPWEFSRYSAAVAKFQKFEWSVMASLNLMNVTQNMVFMVGLLTVCFINAYQVTQGQSDVGKFTTLLFYMAQLQAPLNFFGTFYRMIQSAMINSERMLELFKVKPTVEDSPTARPIPSCEGSITFKDVRFAYDDRKPALNGLNFSCPPGTTTALVGESGGGKSTVFRLLFRFYDQQSGSIQVDGHDVHDITIDSLRRQIGVVPQDTVLFNETLMYNLKYANQSASDEDVYNACKAASIHDKIMNFPDKYNTRVGERGLRLSGGEKQRVAIARTILKNPRIILLDEATAALDTETEEHIQEALTTLGAGRTMLIIAHRLSTITLADQILVLHEGHVAESGTHDDLLARNGRYASMWRKQAKAQRAAERAQALHDHALRLRAAADDAASASASHSEDDTSDALERGAPGAGVAAAAAVAASGSEARPQSAHSGAIHTSVSSDLLARKAFGGVNHP